MRILVIDNYDSFVYNLVHIIREDGHQIEVMRNDHIDMDRASTFDKFILSPGPGIPREAGDLLEFIKKFAPNKSMLGVCLGHQAIGEAFGSKLLNLTRVYHGVASEIQLVKKDYIFNDLPTKLNVGRYHSWVIDPENLGPDLEILAKCNEGQIQAIRHKKHDLRGLQFHPESILTSTGKKMILNFLHQPFSESSLTRKQA